MSNRLAFIIEDDEDLAIIFAGALKAAGLDTRVIRSGDVALAQLAVSTPDVVVLDLHLPNVAGTDILRHIRSDPRLAQARVIVATADPRLADMLQSQADLVLIKPISFSQLRDLATRLTGAPRANNAGQD